ncbi:MAG: formyltransferase family protein [Bacteroidia bacterium]
MKKVTIAFSGQGTLARALGDYFLSKGWQVQGVVDRPRANQKALTDLGIPVSILPPYDISAWRAWVGKGGLVLAGYLRRIPAALCEELRGRSLNCHPSLLPRFGGKGMYGRRVHEAVLAAGEKESGFTIHILSPEYDAGEKIFQVRIPILPGTLPEQLEAFIQHLERQVYPRVAELYLLKTL